MLHAYVLVAYHMLSFEAETSLTDIMRQDSLLGGSTVSANCLLFLVRHVCNSIFKI